MALMIRHARANSRRHYRRSGDPVQMPTPPQGLCAFLAAILISVIVTSVARAVVPYREPVWTHQHPTVNRELKDDARVVSRPWQARAVSIEKFTKPIDGPKPKKNKKRRHARA